MDNCLICKKEITHPTEGFTMDTMGWVCSTKCRDFYLGALSGLKENIKKSGCPQCQYLSNYGVLCAKCSTRKNDMPEKTYIEQAVNIVKEQAKLCRENSKASVVRANDYTTRAMDYDKIAERISKLVPDDVTDIDDDAVRQA